MGKVTFRVLMHECRLCGALGHNHMLMLHIGTVCKDCQPRGEMISAVRQAKSVALLLMKETDNG